MENNTLGARQFESLRRSGIRRGRQRWFGGVASGYAERMGVSPLLVRAGFILLTFFGGLGLIIYGLSWALVPEPDGRIHLQEALGGRFDGALALAGAVTLLGVLPTGVFGPVLGVSAGVFTIAGVLGIIAAAALAMVLLFHTLRQQTHAPSPLATGAPVGGGWTGVSGAGGEFTGGGGASSSESVLPREDAWHEETVPLEHPTQEDMPLGDTPLGDPEAPGEAPPLPPVYRKAAAPRRRRSPGPGLRAVALSVAVTLLAAAAMLAGWHWGTLDLAFPPVAIAGAIVAGLGLIITVLGVMGRRGGVINLFAITAILIGGAFGAITFDRYSADALAWGQDYGAYYFDVRVGSVEELRNIDWSLAAQSTSIIVTIDIPVTETPGHVSVTPPPGTHLQIEHYRGFPLELLVSGAGAEIHGDFYSGALETHRAVGSRDSGYFSIAAGGSLRYSTQPAMNTLTLDIDAPGSTVVINDWNE